jgi:hypothetical protein
MRATRRCRGQQQEIRREDKEEEEELELEPRWSVASSMALLEE